MEHIIGGSVAVFVVITLLSGFLTYLSAKSCALGWKSLRMALLYTGLIVIANRFLLYALRGAGFFDIVGLLITGGVLTAMGYGIYRYFRVEILIKQYPWLYERTSYFTSRHKVTDSTVFE